MVWGICGGLISFGWFDFLTIDWTDCESAVLERPSVADQSTKQIWYEKCLEESSIVHDGGIPSTIASPILLTVIALVSGISLTFKIRKMTKLGGTK